MFAAFSPVLRWGRDIEIREDLFAGIIPVTGENPDMGKTPVTGGNPDMGKTLVINKNDRIYSSGNQ
jgi:hypothetical protein